MQALARTSGLTKRVALYVRVSTDEQITIVELCLYRRHTDDGLDGERRRRVGLCRDQSGAGPHRSHCRTEGWQTTLGMN